MASTFLKLLEMADLNEMPATAQQKTAPEMATQSSIAPSQGFSNHQSSLSVNGLHYNIQIHLPPTKDVEIYNAIFKSMKEHLFEK